MIVNSACRLQEASYIFFFFIVQATTPTPSQTPLQTPSPTIQTPVMVDEDNNVVNINPVDTVTPIPTVDDDTG